MGGFRVADAVRTGDFAEDDVRTKEKTPEVVVEVSLRVHTGDATDMAHYIGRFVAPPEKWLPRLAEDLVRFIVEDTADFMKERNK